MLMTLSLIRVNKGTAWYVLNFYCLSIGEADAFDVEYAIEKVAARFYFWGSVLGPVLTRSKMIIHMTQIKPWYKLLIHG